MLRKHECGSGLLWFESAGGPLVMVPERALHGWSGAAGGGYDLACATENYFEELQWSGETVFVLGDEPLSTTMLRTPEAEIALLRWRYADSEASIRRCLQRAFWRPPVEVLESVAGTSAHVLFDAAEAGRTAADTVQVELSPGPLTVETYEVAPDEHTAGLVHVLRRPA